MSILIADDDHIAHVIIKKNLEYANARFRIYQAHNGKDTIQMLKDHDDISLLLLDLNMPIMNGIEVLKELDRNSFDIPTIVITSSNLESDRIACSQFSNVVDFVEKPFNLQQAHKVISNMKVYSFR